MKKRVKETERDKQQESMRKGQSDKERESDREREAVILSTVTSIIRCHWNLKGWKVWIVEGRSWRAVREEAADSRPLPLETRGGV